MFKDKIVLILSPQPWDSRPVSKHNYAKVVAKSAKVYFLNPISYRFLLGNFTVRNVQKNINVVNITLPIPKFFKFHLYPIYFFWLKWYMNKIKKHAKRRINIYWEFDKEINVRAYNIFKGAFKIFHPVDDFDPKEDINYARFDVCFTVSEAILKKIPHPNKYVINHGLTEVFESFASRLVNQQHNEVKTVKTASYVGNLSIPTLDVEMIKQIIMNHKELMFNFIGNYDEETEFVHFLKAQHNVHLLGLKLDEELIEALYSSDILFLCYKYMVGNNMDNSHKVLEYLSTGKVVVSSKLSCYEKLDLFPMCFSLDNNEYPMLFKDVVSNYSKYNTQELIQNRIRFALDNTYDKQLKKIESIIQMF